nr:hypothetical protein CFP56_16261 [Quercus suber]
MAEPCCKTIVLHTTAATVTVRYTSASFPIRLTNSSLRPHHVASTNDSADSRQRWGSGCPVASQVSREEAEHSFASMLQSVTHEM